VRKPQLRVVAYHNSPTARFVVEGLRVNGKRKRLFFRSKAQAELELARIKHKRTKEGEDALAIADSLRIMARDCAAQLAPYGKSIADATAYYLRHLEALATSINVEALVSEYQDSRRRAGFSTVHLNDLKYRLGAFARDFGPVSVREITASQIEHWLHGLGLGPVSTNNFRTRLVALFSYARARHYVDANPLEAVSKVREPARAPEIFTPAQLAVVLANSPSELVPAIAIGAFAGLRTAELLRLDWREVDWRRGYVHVLASKAKSARRRLIPISDNLARWLRPYAAYTGKLYRKSAGIYHGECARVVRLAGLERWPQNGLRHSFASYHLAKHQNAHELALLMGHTSSAMIFQNYRELVTPEAAARYWAVSPPDQDGVIVPIQLQEAAS
jgi:integrase